MHALGYVFCHVQLYAISLVVSVTSKTTACVRARIQKVYIRTIRFTYFEDSHVPLPHYLLNFTQTTNDITVNTNDDRQDDL